MNELDAEWDIERLLEVNASALAFSGAVLSVLRGRSWIALSASVMGFLFLHGVQGWCPPLPVLRRMGIRTRGEIDREKFALSQLHGKASGNGKKENAKADAGAEESENADAVAGSG